MRPAALATILMLTIPQHAGPRFEHVQRELFSAGGTLTNAWADYDGDGDPDLFVGFNGAPNRLYRNDGGRFVDVAGVVGLADARPTRAAAWGDHDGDGDADLLLGFTPGGGPVLRLYRNDRGTFSDVTDAFALRVDSGSVRQATWVDVEGDGDLDLFVAFRDGPNRLFVSSEDRFVEAGARFGLDDARRSVGAVWLDFDADGDMDVYVANMDGDANGLFRNDGGRFADVAEDLDLAWGGRSAGDPGNGTVRPCAADVDGDGRLDLFMANYGPNGLFLNRGDHFVDVSRQWGIARDSRYDSCAFGDFDNDGRVDLYVNGTITGGTSHPDHLFRNAGDRFEEVTAPLLTGFDGDHGVQWADFDADGDLDIALTTAASEGSHALLRNLLEPAAGLRSIAVAVLDAAGRPVSPGAEVRIYETRTDRLVGTRLVDTGSGYNSQSILPLHFGLPDTGPVDVEVIVPAGNRRVRARLQAVDPAGLGGHLLKVRLDGAGGLSVVR